LQLNIKAASPGISKAYDFPAWIFAHGWGFILLIYCTVDS
jgi:hypothetical protein